jgi:hypothetical protein
MADVKFNTADIELLTLREVMGLMRLSYRGVLNMIKHLPEGAVIRRKGRGNGFLVHAWALAKPLQMERCPGCGREWPEGTQWKHLTIGKS